LAEDPHCPIWGERGQVWERKNRKGGNSPKKKKGPMHKTAPREPTAAGPEKMKKAKRLESQGETDPAFGDQRGFGGKKARKGSYAERWRQKKTCPRGRSRRVKKGPVVQLMPLYRNNNPGRGSSRGKRGKENDGNTTTKRIIEGEITKKPTTTKATSE